MSYWDGSHWVADAPAAVSRPRSIARRLLGATAEAGLISVLIFGLIASSAFAGKGGNGSRPGGGGSGGGTLVLKMVRDANANATPNWNDVITFDVSTTATSQPYVLVNCSQGGSGVYTASAGFFAAYPWPATYTLASSWWTAGEADCVAKLYYNGGRKTVYLATLNFHVDA